ncbi:MAG: hypothetical protein FWG89_09725 [Treponema sp.]|nr:hypothetical protein [Treponema sp.]
MINEIWVLEVIVIALLALPHIKSIVKPIQNLSEPVSSDGLSWLSFIALGIVVGIFPAYGFRPECLPILIYALLMSIGSLISFATRIISPAGEFYYNRKPVVSILALFFLLMTTLPMFIFFPRHREYIRLLADDQIAIAEPDITVKLENTGKEYFLRIYYPGNTTDHTAATETRYQRERPVIFIVPPDIGSAISIDLICTQLLEMGYTLVTYFRKGYDSPLIDDTGRKHPTSPVILLRHWRIFRQAVNHISINRKGKNSEAERMADVEFLLSHLPALLDDTENNNVPPLILAGYGAGGSALAYLAGDENFSSRYSNVLGVTAIESYLWSSYQNEHYQAPQTPAVERRSRIRSSFIRYLDQEIRRHWLTFTNRMNELRPQRIVRSGPLPGENISPETLQRIPVLYLVSGRALMNNQRVQKPYQAVFDTLRDGSGPAALVAIESAGPLDYQDFPFTHPVVSFLFPGLKGVTKSENPVSDTAGIISNYTTYLLEQTGQEFPILPSKLIGGSLYVESKGLPAFRL